MDQHLASPESLDISSANTSITWKIHASALHITPVRGISPQFPA
jgi:hypothetical protein